MNPFFYERKCCANGNNNYPLIGGTFGTAIIKYTAIMLKIHLGFFVISQYHGMVVSAILIKILEIN